MKTGLTEKNKDQSHRRCELKPKGHELEMSHLLEHLPRSSLRKFSPITPDPLDSGFSAALVLVNPVSYLHWTVQALTYVRNRYPRTDEISLVVVLVILVFLVDYYLLGLLFRGIFVSGGLLSLSFII